MKRSIDCKKMERAKANRKTPLKKAPVKPCQIVRVCQKGKVRASPNIELTDQLGTVKSVSVLVGLFSQVSHKRDFECFQRKAYLFSILLELEAFWISWCFRLVSVIMTHPCCDECDNTKKGIG